MSATIEPAAAEGSSAAMERADTMYTAITRGLALTDALHFMTQATIRQGGVHADAFRAAVEALAESLQETLKKALEPCDDLVSEEQAKTADRVMV